MGPLSSHAVNVVAFLRYTSLLELCLRGVQEDLKHLQPATWVHFVIGILRMYTQY